MNDKEYHDKLNEIHKENKVLLWIAFISGVVVSACSILAIQGTLIKLIMINSP